MIVPLVSPTLLLLLILIPVTSTLANHCDVFNPHFWEEADGCIQIQEAVRNTFNRSKYNSYIIESLFYSHHVSTPTALIVNFNFSKSIVENRDDIKADHYKSLLLKHYETPIISHPNHHSVTEENDVECTNGTCTISVGWTSSSIYSFIRPVILLSMQPAWFLCALHFSVHEHFGYPKQVTVHMDFHPEELPENTSTEELRYHLEQLTSQVCII